jgi:hypothetical protein
MGETTGMVVWFELEFTGTSSQFLIAVACIVPHCRNTPAEDPLLNMPGSKRYARFLTSTYCHG